jgi:hypothetical protein
MKQLTNTPVSVMCIPVKDGAVTRDKHIKAQALPMALAMQWTEDADALSAALLSAATGPDRAKAMGGILDAVATYAADFPAQDIRDNASAVQVISAFEVLRELNDPLAVAREKQQAEMDKNMENLRTLQKIAPEKVQNLIEMQS